MNQQSRDKGNIGHKTQNKDKPNIKAKKMSSTDPFKRQGLNPGARLQRVSSSCLL